MQGAQLPPNPASLRIPNPSSPSRTLHPPKPARALTSPIRVPAGWRRRPPVTPASGDSPLPIVSLSPSRSPEIPPWATSGSPAATAAASPPVSSSTAAGVVREFYDGVNRRDFASVGPLIAEDCVYEDLVFSRPFVGRKAILGFLVKFADTISSDLQFVIDDISSEDSLAIGVTWHLDWKGKPFPFSKGCSFYRLEVLDGKRQIVYGRDCVEPAIKPGEIALVLVKAVTWILQRFPQLADRF